MQQAIFDNDFDHELWHTSDANLAPGDTLPSVPDLTWPGAVKPGAIRHALIALASDGLVDMHHSRIATVAGDPNRDKPGLQASRPGPDHDRGSLRARSSGDGLLEVDQPAWRNRATIGQEFAHVVEDDNAVAQQAPPLIWVEGDGVGRVAVRTVS